MTDEISVVELDSNIKQDTSKCIQCGVELKYRKNKTFCGDTCRKASKRAEDKKSTSPKSRATLDRYARIMDMAKRCADEYYTKPFDQREAYIIHVIACAHNSTHTRDMLTSPNLVSPDKERLGLFRNGDSFNYLTISEIANRYCKVHHKTDIYKAMKEKTNIKHKGADMKKIDSRYSYKESEYKEVCEKDIDEKMQGRKQWVIDYYKQVMGVKTEKMDVAA